MLLEIAISLTVAFTVLLCVLLFVLWTSFGDIKRNIRLFFLRKHNYGVVAMIGKDGLMREKVVKFGTSFDEDKNKYIMNDHNIVWKGRVPYLFYNIGISMPKNMTLKEKAPPSNVIYDLVATAMMEMPQSWSQKLANVDPKQMFTMATLAGVALLVFMIFNMQDSITAILKAVT